MCHVARYDDGGRRAVVADAHFVVAHLAVIHTHARDLAQREGLAHNGQRTAVTVGHIARLRCRKAVGDCATTDVQRLGAENRRQHQRREEGI